MLSMSVQPSLKATLKGCPTSVFKDTSSAPSKPSLYMKSRAFHLHSSKLKSRSRRAQQIPASAAAATEVAPAETPAATSEAAAVQEPQLAAVAAKSVAKPHLLLKFIWMEKNIGVALDQQIPGHGTVPLIPYFFWPSKDAWEELKATLESKPWISQKKMIILLNQATDIINLWQQSGGNFS